MGGGGGGTPAPLPDTTLTGSLEVLSLLPKLLSKEAFNFDKFILGTLEPAANSTIGFLGPSFSFLVDGGAILFANIFLIAANPPPPPLTFIGCFPPEDPTGLLFEGGLIVLVVGFFDAAAVLFVED